MCRCRVTAATCAYQWRLHSRVPLVIARGRNRFTRLVWRPKVSLGIQDSLDSVGRGGCRSYCRLLASDVRHCQS